MKYLVTLFCLSVFLYAPMALADVAPSKPGCSTMGGVDIGVTMLPLILLMGLLMMRKKEA